jgi:restriction system protein
MAADDPLLAKVPKYHDLIYPTLKALKALGGSGANEEILDKVCELEKFPAEVEQFPHNDNHQTEINYRLAWARSYLKSVGAVENVHQGVWTLTEKGASLTSDDCKKIPAEVRKKLAEDRKKKSVETVGDGDTDIKEANGDTWRDTLLSVILNIKPDAFERLAQRILRVAGFTKVEVKGKSGDGGIDGIGILKVNLVSFTVLFQCKRYKGSVASSDNLFIVPFLILSQLSLTYGSSP